MAQKMTFGFFGGSSQRVEYVRLRGPHDKGHAEIAVSKPKGCLTTVCWKLALRVDLKTRFLFLTGAGVSTPTSEPGFSMTDGWGDSESESDTEEFVFKHHVRYASLSLKIRRI